MNDLYKYETDQFGISDDSIHLLRNRFNFKTIHFENIDSITIRKGKDIKNWLWVLTIGLGLLIFVGYDLISIYNLFYDGQTFVIYIERLLIPLIPLLLGVYSVVISFRRTMVMVIQTSHKQYYFSLRQLIKANRYNEFTNTMKQIYPIINIRD